MIESFVGGVDRLLTPQEMRRRNQIDKAVSTLAVVMFGLKERLKDVKDHEFLPNGFVDILQIEDRESNRDTIGLMWGTQSEGVKGKGARQVRTSTAQYSVLLANVGLGDGFDQQAQGIEIPAGDGKPSVVFPFKSLESHDGRIAVKNRLLDVFQNGPLGSGNRNYQARMYHMHELGAGAVLLDIHVASMPAGLVIMPTYAVWRIIGNPVNPDHHFGSQFGSQLRLLPKPNQAQKAEPHVFSYLHPSSQNILERYPWIAQNIVHRNSLRN